MRIRFTINGAVYHAVLQDNPIAEKVAAMCPFEAQYSRGGDHEYYAGLPERVAVESCVSTMQEKKRRSLLF